MSPTRPRDIRQYGDFQTPPDLARAVCRLVAGGSQTIQAVIEPTCGVGAFLHAAAETWPGACLIGADINPAYLNTARCGLQPRDLARTTLIEDSFFAIDWETLLAGAAGPIAVIGNPPWVTNAALGGIESQNRPARSAQKGLTGLAALTGKSNFDISEWMLQQSLKWLAVRGGVLAVICKTAVARKLVRKVWEESLPVTLAAIRRIDALASFGASVSACVLHLEFGAGPRATICQVFDTLPEAEPAAAIALRGAALVSDSGAYDRLAALDGADPNRVWRSGVKHDCAAVMEWPRACGPDIEPDLVFPLLKSSDLARGDVTPRKSVLIPQTRTGDDTGLIEERAPRTWAYLQGHQARLAARGSRIYARKPPFSIFGIGPYSFAPWKVAVSGLYKSLRFVPVPPFEGRPVILDDTAYFLPCTEENEARRLAGLLNSPDAQDFLASLIFPDAKRPVTIEVLRRLNIAALESRAAGPR